MCRSGHTAVRRRRMKLQWMLDGYFRQKGIRERVTIEYFTREAEPTGEAHDPVGMDGRREQTARHQAEL